MNIINIHFINTSKKLKINIIDNITTIKIYIKNVEFEINNIKNIINLLNYEKINIKFDKSINIILINSIITKLHNLLYNYKNKLSYNNIKLYNIKSETTYLMEELYLYKDIIIDPNKTPYTYLKYVKSRIPNNYIYKVININKSKLFPLSKAVGQGSQYKSYFVHIYPKDINIKKKSIFLVGKGVCFDTGGLNLKKNDFSDMKIDMKGSAIVVSVLNLLVKNKYDSKYNIHIVSSIVENMISNKAVRPGAVIKTLNNKTVEIINTDAEGRLCIVDNINYINKYLLNNNNSIIIDIATLTGNASNISADISSIISSNKNGYIYANKLIDIGNSIHEYVDYLKIYKEYYKMLDSSVADIKSINTDIKSDCILAATFISYFVKDNIPWIHIDLGSVTFKKSIPLSYGINLLYEFIKNL